MPTAIRKSENICRSQAGPINPSSSNPVIPEISKVSCKQDRSNWPGKD